jgi:hypothetical protein
MHYYSCTQRVYPNPRKHGEFCRYMPSPAMPLGLVAAALSLTTQVLASTVIGCCGAWRNVPSQTRRLVAVLLFVSSWYVYKLKSTPYTV